jgi:hypothetical protein
MIDVGCFAATAAYEKGRAAAGAEAAPDAAVLAAATVAALAAVDADLAAEDAPREEEGEAV